MLRAQVRCLHTTTLHTLSIRYSDQAPSQESLHPPLNLDWESLVEPQLEKPESDQAPSPESLGAPSPESLHQPLNLARESLAGPLLEKPVSLAESHLEGPMSLVESPDRLDSLAWSQLQWTVEPQLKCLVPSLHQLPVLACDEASSTSCRMSQRPQCSSSSRSSPCTSSRRNLSGIHLLRLQKNTEYPGMFGACRPLYDQFHQKPFFVFQGGAQELSLG
uniref:Uncharacterized protein n=1 Tax=Arundo donax TaxID=35708 RepID=A0A0A9CN99_ARUDO